MTGGAGTAPHPNHDTNPTRESLMRIRNLPRHASAWAHPYTGPAALAVLYADGGDDGVDEGKDSQGDGKEKTDKPSTGDGQADGSQAGAGDQGDTTDWKTEAEKWKAQSRKHEDRAKANAGAVKELAELKRQGMSETEKAVDEAAAKARVEERTRLSGMLARPGFIAAAAGRIDNPGTVTDDLNLSRYVGEDGEVDEKGLAGLVDRLAPKKAATGTGDGRGFDQGARGTGRQEKPAASAAAGRDLWAERHKKKTTL